MRILNFAKRNFKELIRDPLCLIFQIVLPLFLLFTFQQFQIPSENYKLENFTPGIILFGFSFISLFTATLISKDRNTSFLTRLAASPMKVSDFVLGYIISLLPLVIIQDVLFFIVARFLGLSITINTLLAILVSIVIAILFICLGILLGCLVSEKASGGIGSIVVQLVCFTSGMYFPKELVGKGFALICEILPFESCYNIIKGILNSNYEIITPMNIIIFISYTVIILVTSMVLFKKKMVCDNK